MEPGRRPGGVTRLEGRPRPEGRVRDVPAMPSEPVDPDRPVDPDQPAGPDLPATSYAVLGLLSFGEELSGYDLKMWADWTIRFFYWSPSFSQIYSHLKRLESLGYVRSRTVESASARDRRLYSITEAGLAVMRRWAATAPLDPPGAEALAAAACLARPPRRRGPARTAADRAPRPRAAARGQRGGAPAGRGPRRVGVSEAALRWAHRYYEAEAALAEALLADLGTSPTARSTRPATWRVRKPPGEVRRVGSSGRPAPRVLAASAGRPSSTCPPPFSRWLFLIGIVSLLPSACLVKTRGTEVRPARRPPAAPPPRRWPAGRRDGTGRDGRVAAVPRPGAGRAVTPAGCTGPPSAGWPE